MTILTEKTKRGTSFKVRERRADGVTWYPQATFKTKAEALRHQQVLIHDRNRERDRLKHLSPGEIVANPLLTASVADYWEYWKRDCRKDVSAGWVISQDQMFRDYINPVIGDSKLHDVTSVHIGNLLNKAEASRQLMPETMNRIYQLLRKMFADAVEHFEVLETSPVKKKFRRKVIIVERDFLRPEQSWKLLAHVRDHWAGPAIHIMVLAGMRIGEVQALKVEDVLFDEGYILIRCSYNRKTKQIQDHPKQGDWGKAPLSPVLAEYLRAKLAGKDSGDFACVGPLGTWLSHNWLYKVLEKLCKEAGVPPVTPHELRHSCTELYVQAGASAEDIRRLLNQSSLTSTARYIHRTDERLNKLAAAVVKPSQ